VLHDAWVEPVRVGRRFGDRLARGEWFRS
jgi:hypothetical protein